MINQFKNKQDKFIQNNNEVILKHLTIKNTIIFNVILNLLNLCLRILIRILNLIQFAIQFISKVYQIQTIEFQFLALMIDINKFDIVISMFGMGLGMDMGMNMGMGMGMMQGAMMEQAMIMDTGMMMGGMGGMGGMGRQQIIVNGNGTTIIQNGRGGIFGGRQQIIISNGQTTMIQNGRGFGRRNNVICIPGCMGPCCRQRFINCGPNCMQTCCRPYQPMRQQPQYYPQNQYNYQQAQRIPQTNNYVSEQRFVTRPQRQVVRQQVLVRNMQTNLAKQDFVENYPKKQEVFIEQKTQFPQTQRFQEQILYSGKVYMQSMGQWQPINPNLTCINFGSIPIKMITKIKVKSQSVFSNCQVIKITAQGRDSFLCVPSNQHCEYFVRTVWARMAVMNKYSNMYAEQSNVAGNILKKAEILGNWEQRYVTININEGLCSYRNPNSSPTLVINSSPQIWTRFEVLMGGQFINIKLKHKGIKYQFGVPSNQAVRWLKAFHSLLRIY